VFPELLRERLSGIVELSPEQVSVLERHYELLVRWNQTLNLTTITDVTAVVERHYCESLFLGSLLPAGSWNVADVGSGPGFPGFPIGVLRPDCTVTLIDSHQRKAVFLKEACRGIKNLRVLGRRAEDVQEEFDWVLSRAVSYKDLTKSLRRLGRCAGLLTGSEAPPNEMGFEWREAVPLAWGDQRFARISCFT
jgi:16S rRNA (guanine527-N7)-methyltransferase